MNLKEKIAKFKDNFGRVDLLPVNGKRFSTNNQLLYTGELAILMACYNKKNPDTFTESEFKSLASAIKHCQLPDFPGLYTRHPEPYRRKVTPDKRVDFRPVSFDEILGCTFTNYFAGDVKANESIVQHGILEDYRYCDVPGFETGLEFKNIFTKGFIKDLISYYKEADSYDKDGFRKASQNYTRFYPVFFRHSASCKLVYNVGARNNIKLYDSLALLTSCIVASLKADNTSTKVLWFFRLKFLELANKETLVIKLAKSIYNLSLRIRLGKNPVPKLFSQYYISSEHPFHEMIKEVV
jgi:hypothetical protein